MDKKYEDFIRKHYRFVTNKKMIEMMKEEFSDLPFKSVAPIQDFRRKNGLKSGLDGRFQAGGKPWNKGKKFPGEVNSGSFKKGQKAWNDRAIGTERVRADGYHEIKIAKNTWKLKHHIIWEEAHGKIPTGKRIVFLDGNKNNLVLENLELVEPVELMNLSKTNEWSSDAEITRASIYNRRLKVKIKKLEERNGKAI